MPVQVSRASPLTARLVESCKRQTKVRTAGMVRPGWAILTGATVDTPQAFRVREVVKGAKVVTIVLTTGVRMIIRRDEEVYAANLIKTVNEETEEAPYI